MLLPNQFANPAVLATTLRMFARSPQGQKAMAAAAFYTVASFGVASFAERRNIGHVFRQLGQN